MENIENSILKRIVDFNQSIPVGQYIIREDKQNELIDIINDVANYGKSIDIIDRDTNQKFNKVFDIFSNNDRLTDETRDKITKIKEEYNNYLANERAKLPTHSFTITSTLPPSSILAPSLPPTDHKRRRRSNSGGKTNKRKRKSISKTNKRKSNKSKK